MPDMPQQAAPAASAPGGQGAPGGPQGGPPGAGGGGGGIEDAIVLVDQTLNQITEAVSKNPQLGDDVKSAFSDALSAFRGASQALVKAAGGGGDEPDADDQGGGTTTPQQGGNSGAVPMTHASMKGG